MPNLITFDGIRLIKCDSAIMQQFSGRRDGAAPNSFTTRWGENPSYGWILLTQQDVDTLDLSATNHTLVLTSDHGTVTIQNLIVTHIESVYLVPFSKPEDLVLLKIEDIRCLGRYTYVDKSWNIVRRSWQDETNKRFTTESTTVANGSALLDAIWAELPAIFGAAPNHDIGAGYVEVTYAEDINLRKVQTWEAVIKAAHGWNLEVTIDNTGQGVLFSPHELASTDYDTERTGFANYRLRSTRTTTPAIVKFPEKVKVLFRKTYTDAVGNSDPDVVSAEEDHLFNSYLEVEVAVSLFTAEPTVTGTEMLMYHDRVVVDRDEPLATYTTLAENLVQSWVTNRDQDEENQVETYVGFIPLTVQAWNMIEWSDRDTGPMTVARLDRPKYGVDHSEFHDRHRTAFGFGQIVTAATKFNRYNNFASIDGRLKPVQRNTNDGLLDISSTKEMEFATISDYPIRPCQNIFWMMDHNSSKPIAIPLGLQTNKPLFIKFKIVLQGGAGSGCPNEQSHPSANALVLDQEWGPTLIGDGLYQRVETSVSGCGTNQIILQEGCTGIAYLREDDVYEAMSSSCCPGSGSQADPDSGALIYETDVRCKNGKLEVWRRYVYIILTDGVLSRRQDAGWVFSHYAGCCDCGSGVVEPPTCQGGCLWVWNDQTALWEYLIDDCSQEIPDCNCDNYPNTIGLFDGEIIEMPCYTGYYPPPPSGSGSGSGAAGCTGTCTYIWSTVAYQWVYQSDNCQEFTNGPQCVCDPPLQDGTFDGEVRTVNCGGAGF